jgi:fructose-bisphosphate aldolase, class I
VSMQIGKLVRLNRIFSHPSGRLCSVAVDHFIGYPEALPAGLRHIARTLKAIVAARPDSVTMHKGVAAAAWVPYAGMVPLIMQSTIARVDDTACEQIATPGDAVRLGADAFAVAAFIRGDSEAAHLRMVADAVRSAARYEMPVICHIYPRSFASGKPQVSYEPEDIAWAVRCAVECGVDVVKVPYCGSIAAYAEIVTDCPVPVVAAGGPQTRTPEAALSMMADVVTSGARGATIGRNIWSAENITATVRAFQAVIHDGETPQQALLANGLAVTAPA